MLHWMCATVYWITLCQSTKSVIERFPTDLTFSAKFEIEWVVNGCNIGSTRQNIRMKPKQN